MFSEIPDETLTEWAIDADVRALAELHSRYAAIAARFAAVVSGRPEESPDVAAAAFSVTLAELAEDRLAIADAFLPRLLRSSRTIALTNAEHGVDARQLASSVPAGTNPVLLAEVFSGLSEPERSALWLSEVAKLSTDDASVALAVSGGTSALRWTRPRSSGLEALVARAEATLGDHRAGAVQALSGVDALLDASHVDAVVADWPKRAKRSRRWVIPPRPWAASTGVREPSLGRVVRFAVILVLIVGAIGFLLDRHDSGTAQTSEVAKHLQVIGAPDGQASSRVDSTQPPRTPHAGAASPSGGGNGSPSGSGSQSGNGTSSTSPSSQGGRPGTGGAGGASASIGVTAASATSLGVGTKSTTTTTPGGVPTSPTTVGPGSPTTTPSPSGPGPSNPTTTTAPVDSPTTTAPPQDTTTTTTTPPTTEPTTVPPTTEPTTVPPTTEPTTVPPTTEPTTTEPTTVPPPPPSPPTTLPPVP